jgi:hypothetical protein
MDKNPLAPLLRWLGVRSGTGSVDRITPQELKQRLDRGDHIEILDVRHWSEALASGDKLPGARWVERAGIESAVVPDGAYVLYCD